MQIENEKRREESGLVEKQMIEVTSECAYFKDLLEKGISVRKELEIKLSDEKSAKSKAEQDASANKLSVSIKTPTQFYPFCSA